MKTYPVLAAALGLAPITAAGQASAGQTTPGGNHVTLLALNQPPCTVPSAAQVLRAKVAYALADTEASELGYAVSIKFQGTNPRLTFSKGLMGQVAVAGRRDTLTITYPMSAIWENARLKRPITCYIYLHRNTGPGRSTVVAKTPPIVFQECQ